MCASGSGFRIGCTLGVKASEEGSLKSDIRTLYAIASVLLPLVLLHCDSSTSNVPNGLFTDLVVGQEWQYAMWERPYSGSPVFTGDIISVSIIDKKDGTVTFCERPVNRRDPASPCDSAVFSFQIEDSLLRQVSTNSPVFGRVFGFLEDHDGILSLTPIDLDPVTVDMDVPSLIRKQTVKSPFIGHSDSVTLFSDTYEDVIIYYDDRFIPVDKPGHLAIFSLKEGMVATIYFGGMSPVYQTGYQLIRR